MVRIWTIVADNAHDEDLESCTSWGGTSCVCIVCVVSISFALYCFFAAALLCVDCWVPNLVLFGLCSSLSFNAMLCCAILLSFVLLTLLESGEVTRAKEREGLFCHHRQHHHQVVLIFRVCHNKLIAYIRAATAAAVAAAAAAAMLDIHLRAWADLLSGSALPPPTSRFAKVWKMFAKTQQQ